MRRRRGDWVTCPPPQIKNRERYFSGKCHEKIRAFSGKCQVKFGNFGIFSDKYHVKFRLIVNFWYIYFRAKMSCLPASWHRRSCAYDVCGINDTWLDLCIEKRVPPSSNVFSSTFALKYKDFKIGLTEKLLLVCSVFTFAGVLRLSTWSITYWIRKESLAHARVTRDSSACLKAPRNLSSAGNATLQPNIMSLRRSYASLKTMAAVRHLVQGHPRSSTLVTTETSYATSY